MARSTRQRLLDVAYDLFSLHGFHNVGLDRILAEVGVTKTTFYNHFESKDDLILAVLEDQDRQELEVIRKALRRQYGRSPRKQLYGFFDVLHTLFNDPDFRGCIFITAAAEFPSPTDPAHLAAKQHKECVEELLCELAELAGVVDPERLAEELIILVEGAVTTRHVANHLNAALIAGRTARLLLDTVLPDPKPAQMPSLIAETLP